MVSPLDITRQLNRPPRWEGWIPTRTGNGFFIIDPKPEDVRLEDIAYGLAHTYRYGGQVEPITVAEHSVLVSLIIEILWPESNKMLAGLMHDACEAYTHNIQAPVRRFIKVDRPDGIQITWGDLERRINQAVAKSIGLDVHYYAAPEVGAADIVALCLEKSQCGSIRTRKWGLPPIPQEVEHLKVRFESPEVARTTFLERFTSLR